MITALRTVAPLARPDVRLLPRSTFISAGSVARHAGAIPNSSAAASPASAVKPSTVPSM